MTSIRAREPHSARRRQRWRWSNLALSDAEYKEQRIRGLYQTRRDEQAVLQERVASHAVLRRVGALFPAVDHVWSLFLPAAAPNVDGPSTCRLRSTVTTNPAPHAMAARVHGRLRLEVMG